MNIAFREAIDGKISVQPHTTLCIQFLDRENNDKNNTLPLGKQVCFTTVWGYAEILPRLVIHFFGGPLITLHACNIY